jgi:hypothetical protein
MREPSRRETMLGYVTDQVHLTVRRAVAVQLRRWEQPRAAPAARPRRACLVGTGYHVQSLNELLAFIGCLLGLVRLGASADAAAAPRPTRPDVAQRPPRRRRLRRRYPARSIDCRADRILLAARRWPIPDQRRVNVTQRREAESGATSLVGCAPRSSGRLSRSKVRPSRTLPVFCQVVARIERPAGIGRDTRAFGYRC